ncbi:MAG: ferrous iron transport protein B, partial [Verrucomicrobiota bacterium]|nr:ferrous iron transport protein B [Verrucomicrobiota bacterium]
MVRTFGKRGQAKEPELLILLAGNPNSGKTSLFNWMAGAHQHVGNYPGVTVEKKSARFDHEGKTIELIDLPGVYSLLAASAEEAISRDEILSGEAGVVIQVLDATNLERNLYLTAQLTEMGMPVVYALNMIDEAEDNGLRFDLALMADLLGGPVIPTNGNTGRGVGTLILTAMDTAARAEACSSHVNYGKDIEPAIAEVAQQFEGDDAVRARRRAISLLDGLEDPHAPARAVEAAQSASGRLERLIGQPMDLQIAEARYGFAHGAATEATLDATPHLQREKTLRLDSLFLHRFWGLPIFVFLMWCVFNLVFTFGEPPMQWIEAGLGRLSVWITTVWPETAAPLLRSLLVDGVIGGVGGVVSFLPNILLLFMAIAFLEDTGYMARVAFLMDRIMHKMGLHGKSFIPMLIGLGCTVPAILATRTLENKRDRFATILVTPFVSCGARLTIYALLIPAFFAPRWRGWVLWGIYMTGIVAAVLLARLLRSTLFRGETTPFVMELPPYRLPTWRSVWVHMWERSWMYLQKAGTIILAISIVLWALGSFPKRTEYTRDYAAAVEQAATPEAAEQLEAEKRAEALEYTAMGRIGRVLEPVIRPLGFDWRVGTALVGAFAAKEVFVAQMGIVFSLGDANEESENLRSALRTAYTPLQGLAMMLFCLLSAPCLATIAVTKRETNSWGWALTMLIGMSLIAWAVTFAVYQTGLLMGWG